MPNESDPLQSLIADIIEAESCGDAVDREAFLRLHPEHADSLREFFANHDSMKARSDAEEVTLAPSGPSSAEDVTLPPSKVASAEEATLAARTSTAGNTATVGDKVRYFGDYELLEEIARGGMGVVFKARQVNLNRVVALKMILSGQLASDEDVKRFYTEAEAAANLDHPGIVPIFEVGQHQGQHYFSMGFIEGQTLAKKVADGPLPPREAADLVQKICEAIAYAHERGVIHRDLKPANILLDQNGQSKVTDFGLAKQMNVDSGLTGTGQILGTPSYMAPEQASGKSEVGPLADVYSVGAILYCLLSGRPPFQASNPMDTLLQVLEQEPIPLRKLNRSVPRDLETIAIKCLNKRPSDRYSAAVDVYQELGCYLEGLPIKGRRIGLARRFSRVAWIKYRTASVVALLVLSAGLSGLGWIAFDAWRRSLVGFRSTDGSPLAVKVSMVGSEDVRELAATQRPSDASLIAGDYEVGVESADLPVQTWMMHVHRGTSQLFSLQPDRDTLWRSIDRGNRGQIECLFPADGHQDLIFAGGNSIARVDAVTGKDIWSSRPELKLRMAGRSLRSDLSSASIFGIANPPKDVDGDGEADLVFARPSLGSVFALSGATGELLWLKDPEEGARALRDHREGSSQEYATVPLLKDVNHDGAADVITTITATSRATGGSQYNQLDLILRRVVALDGRTGEPIWHRNLPAEWFQVELEQLQAHYKSGLRDPRLARLRMPDSLQRSGAGEGELEFGSPSPVAQDGNGRLLVVAGNRLVALNAESGEFCWEPAQLNGYVVDPLQLFKPDAARNSEACLLTVQETRTAVTDIRGQVFYQFPVAHWTAINTDDGSALWETTADGQPLSAVLPARVQLKETPWPLFVTNSEPEVASERFVIAAFDINPKTDSTININDRVAQELWEFDIATGARLSRTVLFDEAEKNSMIGQLGPGQEERALRNLYADLLHSLSGFDVNGDGVQDVFNVAGLAEFYGGGYAVLNVSTVSGADGGILNRSTFATEAPEGSRESHDFQLTDLQQDGWPMLLCQLGRQIFLVSTRTGEKRPLPEILNSALIADTDLDGVQEIVGASGKQLSLAATERWRRLGSWQPAPDLDGDGFEDLVTRNPWPEWHSQDFVTHNYIAACSGDTGDVLWSRNMEHQRVIPLRELENGEWSKSSVRLIACSWDVLESRQCQNLAITALEAETGKTQWTYRLPASRLFAGADVTANHRLQAAIIPDTNADATADLIFYCEIASELAAENESTCLWTILSGTDGSHISSFQTIRRSNSHSLHIPQVADLDGDGLSDISVSEFQAATSETFSEGESHIKVFRGKDGSMLQDFIYPELKQSFHLEYSVHYHNGGSFEKGWFSQQSRKWQVTDADGDNTLELIALNSQSISLVESDGSLRWQHPIYGNADAALLLMELETSGRKFILVEPKRGDRLAVFTPEGGTFDCKVEATFDYYSKMHPVRLEAAGKAAIVCVHREGMCALELEFVKGLADESGFHAKTLWKRSTLESRGELRVIQPSESASAVLALRTTHGWMGMDGKTGADLWSISMPGTAKAPTPQLLLTPAAREAPSFVCVDRESDSIGVICRTARPGPQ